MVRSKLLKRGQGFSTARHVDGKKDITGPRWYLALLTGRAEKMSFVTYVGVLDFL